MWTPLWCLRPSLKHPFAPVGRRWTSGEEDGTEQQPRSCAGRGREGGGPEQPAPGAGGPVLHRRRGHREDRLVEAARGGRLGAAGAAMAWGSNLS